MKPFTQMILDETLDDSEDYNNALRICAEIDAGHMKVYSLKEVEQHLDALGGNK